MTKKSQAKPLAAGGGAPELSLRALNRATLARQMLLARAAVPVEEAVEPPAQRPRGENLAARPGRVAEGPPVPPTLQEALLVEPVERRHDRGVDETVTDAAPHLAHGEPVGRAPQGLQHALLEGAEVHPAEYGIRSGRPATRRR